jgi:hypothetical protein
MATRRDEKGRFIQIAEDIGNTSVVARIINEELDQFWERATQRLNELDTASFIGNTQEEINAAKMDIKAAVAARFGNPVTASCMTVPRGPTPWNGYIKANFKRKRDEIDGDGGNCPYMIVNV